MRTIRALCRRTRKRSLPIHPKRWMFATFSAGLLLFLLHRLVNSRTFQVFGEPVARVPCTGKYVALTLDDGPTPEGTDQLLELLARHHARATFFLIGKYLERYPEAGLRIARAGYEIGNHSYSHSRMILRSQSFIRREVEWTDRAIRATGYSGEILFRPPRGVRSEARRHPAPACDARSGGFQAASAVTSIGAARRTRVPRGGCFGTDANLSSGGLRLHLTRFAGA